MCVEAVEVEEESCAGGGCGRGEEADDNRV